MSAALDRHPAQQIREYLCPDAGFVVRGFGPGAAFNTINGRELVNYIIADRGQVARRRTLHCGAFEEPVYCAAYPPGHVVMDWQSFQIRVKVERSIGTVL